MDAFMILLFIALAVGVVLVGNAIYCVIAKFLDRNGKE